ncbi:structural maintenance of chromosomes protein 4-like [Gordionus sp. m RMFG-2023]|uniref:structural maintenance of chromosomes protein 4-like n=1 Tax=Gordionus sp. m RMFG-2023 TaxID=3053472 RepID=UPI0031FBC1DE
MDVDIIETDDCGNSNLLKSLGIQIPDSLSKVANYDPLGPKLLIHQIENENFKSYYGKQILGPFHKNYTAIIGPNGSGKSNVIDSMLFVFGFRAAKIRSKKVSVLIHNSSKHSNINSCTVKVFFRKIVEISMKYDHKQVTKDNQHNGERILATPEEPDKDEEGDHDPFNTSTTASSQLKKSTPTYQESIDTGFSVVPGSEFVISRTAFKDNSSYYCIDGKKTNFKEMSDFLKSHGIDLDHNRFLILQGEVEMISLMKPKATNENEEGMLEFLEDIIGSNRFKPALSTMKQVLETENEKRASMLNRFKSTEKELKALEAPLEGAIQYLSLENEIIKNRNALLQINEYEANKAMVQKETKFKEAEQTLKDLSESLAGNEDAKKDIDVQYKSKYKEFETATNSLGENKKKLTELEMADAKIRENYKHLNAKNQGLVKSVEIERNKVIKHQSTIANNREYLSNHEAKLESLKISKCSQESALQIATEALKENTKELRLKKEKKEKRLVEDVENKYIQAKSSLDKAKGELKIYTEHVEGNLNKAKNLQKKIGEIETCKSDIKTKLNELTQDILPRYESQADTLKKKIEDVKNEERGVEHQLKEGRDKMKLAQDNLTALTNSLTNADCGSGDSNAQQGNPFRNRVLRALKESESNGELDGIYGRLGDLGRVDPIYDVALSSACGSTLDNILVRDEDTARDCINILKRLKLPPTTFICLNKMRYNANTDRIKDKNQRLFDKITTVNEKFESAFFYATRETLLARDINEATRLADSSSRRQRVVTMGGEVVEISGTLTGGGSRPMSGKMASKFLVEYNSANDKINYLHQKNSNKSIQV